MKHTLRAHGFLLALCLVFAFSAAAQGYLGEAKVFYDAVKVHDFAAAAKSVNVFARASADDLESQLDTENKAKAFWLNLYNTFVAYSLAQNPSQFDDRGKFFKTEFITIAGQKLSLDDIEHGIIRHSRNKLSMGYLGKVAVPDFEKRFRLADIDWRIHFALNCGAKSCPPVSFYDWKRLDQQLNLATADYLARNTRYDAPADAVFVPMLCSWFRADFDGEDGVREIMKKHGIVPAARNPSVKYNDYDWTLLLNNYKEW
ncbi:MAG: DUF547 domain-containing protein [Cyclobacteriaceae bacterium]|jgi:hypothetical protein